MVKGNIVSIGIN